MLAAILLWWVVFKTMDLSWMVVILKSRNAAEAGLMIMCCDYTLAYHFKKFEEASDHKKAAQQT